MRRVGITGFGIVSPIGVGRKRFEDGLRSVRSGVVYLPEAEAFDTRCRVAARVPADEIGAEPPDTPFGVHFALEAAGEAIRAARLEPELLKSPRVGVNLACCGGAVTFGYHYGRAAADPVEFRRVAKRLPTSAIPVVPSAYVAIAHGIRGRVASTNAACTGGLVAIGQAVEWVAAGVADVVLAGGTEPLDAAVSFYTFDTWRALPSDSNEHPSAACRPFDVSRRGFVTGEGAGIVVVESLEHAKARGADVLAEVVGFAATNDGADIKRPTGDGLERCLRAVLEEARAAGVDEIDYLKPHGAGTAIGDPCEVEVIKACFGDRSPRISSLKPLCGHGLAACGAIELIGTLAMLDGGFVVPTRNLVDLDPACAGVDHVIGAVEEREVRAAIAMNMGLGGTNAALAVRRPD